MRSLLRIACVVLTLLVTTTSFQNIHHVKSISSVTEYREIRRKCGADSSLFGPMVACQRKCNGSTTMRLSNDDKSEKNTDNYNDDAFGFVLLVGYVVTHDIIFAGTFVLLSALAAIATRNGTLPAKNSVPATVAGLTYIVNLILPKEGLYDLFPFIERPETSLPVDLSLVELGICSVSILYGFFLSSKNQE